jgi:hypothetical protein
VQRRRDRLPFITLHRLPVKEKLHFLPVLKFQDRMFLDQVHFLDSPFEKAIATNKLVAI